MICYTRPKNIKDSLCRGKLPPARTNIVARAQEDGFKRCNKSRCKLWPFVGEATKNKVIKSVMVSKTGENYKIRGKLNCASKTFCTL